MKKFDYTDEATFTTESVEFEDEHVQIAEQLLNSIDNYGPLVVGKDKNSLVFGVNRGTTRLERERGDKLYRIRIEKVLPNDLSR